MVHSQGRLPPLESMSKSGSNFEPNREVISALFLGVSEGSIEVLAPSPSRADVL
jgi:hypothetical protein